MKKRKKAFRLYSISKENGEIPFLVYSLSLPCKMKAKVVWAIGLLREKGTELREPYSSPLGYGLFELRIKFGSDIVRCLYFFYKGQFVIPTNGFTKKTEKTPRREIEKAKRYREGWIRRNAK